MGQQTIIRDGFVSKGDSQFNGSAEIINTSGFGLTITGSSAGAFIGNRSGGVHTLTMQADTAGRGLLILNSTGSTANYAVKGLDVNVQSNVSNIQSYAQVNIGTTRPLTLNSLGGFVGINTGNNVTPSAALHVKGSAATSGTTALRVENSSATAALTVRDDSLVSIMPDNSNITIDGSTSSGGRILIQNPTSNARIGIASYNTILYPTELRIYSGTAIAGYVNALGDFRFYNGSTTKTYMYISSTGLIGVNKGTVTPNAELDVSGSVIITGSFTTRGTVSLGRTTTTNAVIQRAQTPGGAYSTILAAGAGISDSYPWSQADTDGASVELRAGPPSTDQYSGGIVFTANGNASPLGEGNAIVFKNRTSTNSYTERMRITYDGKVGIGTYSPTSILTIVGAGGSSGLNVSDGSASDFIVTPSEPASGTVRVGPGTGDMALYSGGSEIARLTTTGLGIGTTSPTTKLHVDGTVRIDNQNSSNPTGPNSSAGTVVNYWGTVDGDFLSTPNTWLKINLSGNDYYLPAYS